MKTRIGFSDAFFGALTNLPSNIQAKVNNLILKFQTNSKSPGLNYEKLTGTKDKNMRSIRVDQAYRIILLAPEKGDVYLFLWVDHHDDAYDWAARHQCKINANTGSLQLYATDVRELDNETKIDSDKSNKAFRKLKDKHLLKFGVPDDQIKFVRTIETERGLDQLQTILPPEAYEALYFFLAGDSYEDILSERDLKEAQLFDVTNFADALDRAQTMAHFAVPENDEELAEMLNAPMEKWRVFLHPTQRKLAEGKKNGAVRVLGGAGTGKTVVAIHRAKWLAESLTQPEDRILFTTFTRNLAVDIANNLASICSPDIQEKIEVVNLDRWVQNFLRQQSYDYRVVFNNYELQEYWHKAISERPADIDFPDSFFKEEWQRVIQPQGVKTIDGYKRASRIGRGTRLTRRQRMAIWPVFEEYRHQLNRARLKETDDAYRDAAELIRNNPKLTQSYTSIIVDEAQDMGSQAFHLLRAIVPEGPNDLFIAGDAHQRIYGRNRVVLGRCGINIRGRSRKLKINYRTTDEIRRWAIRLLEGRAIDDLDGGSDSNAIYKSLTHGQAPLVEPFNSPEDQAGFIKTLLESSDEPYSGTCVVARTNAEVSAIQDQLNAIGVETSIIEPNKADDEKSTALKLATVHRVKGLEFDQLILASANNGLVPLDIALRDKGDEISRVDAETEERSLVYVAVTRARKKAFVLSCGQMSPFFA